MSAMGSKKSRPKSDDFEIIWENISFSVSFSLPNRVFQRIQGARHVPKIKQILKGISGHISSGEMIALMGPSGAGKTTLMESIVGLRDGGKTGDVHIYGEDLRSVRVSFVAQKNFFLKYLTVRETIYYATKIHTATKLLEGTVTLNDESGRRLTENEYCSQITDKMIGDLGLTGCQHNRVPHCSGGQIKRVAIAQELVTKPRIMVLDEPTSGLDSASCYQVVDMLREMTQQSPKIAVLLTIHQPSYKILNLFHKLYFMSSNAECIFEDSPAELLPTLTDCGLTNIHGFNPAEIMLEVASGDYGEEVTRLLGDNQKMMHRKYVSNHVQKKLPIRKLDDLLQRDKYPTKSHIMTLVSRNYYTTIRDPIAFAYRISSVFGVGIFLTTVFGRSIGIRGGCPPNFDADFEPSQLKDIGDEIEAEVKGVYNNVGNMFFITLFTHFSALMPSCLTFPDEMRVFKMEKENSWYGSKAFYAAKFIAETPFQIAVLSAFLPMTYVMQNQITEVWRFVCVYTTLLLCEYVASTLGFITGTIFMYNVPASVYLGPTLCMIPFMLMSGAFAKTKDFSEPFQWISMTSYLRFAIESISVALYGFKRCGNEVQKRLMDGKGAFIVWMSAMLGIYNDDNEAGNAVANGTESAAGVASERFVEELLDAMAGDFISDEDVVRSAVQNIYGYEDWHLYRGMLSLFVYLLALRILAFSIIKMRVKGA